MLCMYFVFYSIIVAKVAFIFTFSPIETYKPQQAFNITNMYGELKSMPLSTMEIWILLIYCNP